MEIEDGKDGTCTASHVGAYVLDGLVRRDEGSSGGGVRMLKFV